jgi:FtsP/CotA-like multicopper oxidase with cupredoxin domain
MTGIHSTRALHPAILLTATLAMAGNVFAKDVCLSAKELNKTLPDGVVVRMWGFAEAPWDGDGATCVWESVGPPTVPGPRITVPPGDTTLRIHFQNDLPPGSEDVSIVIPGLGSGVPQGTTPQVFTDGQGRQRVRAFADEVAPGSQMTYQWTVEPGTYLYQSGSHPAVQVQMGLYGAVTKDAAAGVAYNGYSYDDEILILYSEIDRGLHDAVRDGDYGPAGFITSTIDYHPSYFLVNGEPFPVAYLPAPITANETTLIRFLNAGLTSHTPTFEGLYMSLIAEDGNPYPFSKVQYDAFLPAGKTVDALLTPTVPGNFPLYDRELDLTNAGLPRGGLLTYVDVVAGGGGAPVADNDNYSTAEDTVLDVEAPGVLAGDTGMGLSAMLVSNAAQGSVTLSSDGSFSYAPRANFSGTDSFTYRASNGSGQSNLATVFIDVTPGPDAPEATSDAYHGLTLNVPAPGVLRNDSDIDGDSLTAVLVGVGPPGAFGFNANGSFTYTPSEGVREASFTYKAVDGGALESNVATVNITIPVPPVLPVARAVTVNVVNGGGVDGAGMGSPIGGGFRWVLQEDTTVDVVPGEALLGANGPITPGVFPLSLQFHVSHLPVILSGRSEGSSATVNLPSNAKRYFVSVLPDPGFDIGGAPIPLGQDTVTVTVQPQPIPTAQIGIYVFEDNKPLNNEPNVAERGLEGFECRIADEVAGRPGGELRVDTCGNPLGSTYDGPSCDNLLERGTGHLRTDARGLLVVKNLAPGKYGVECVPPAGQEKLWYQTTTIEGGPAIDAWIQPNNGRFLTQFAEEPEPLLWSVFIGFAKLMDDRPGGVGSIAGEVRVNRMNRPPSTDLESAPLDMLAHTELFVALNLNGEAIYNQPIEEDGTFSINGLPDGAYDLVIWDRFLDVIIFIKRVNIPGPGGTQSVNLGEVRVWPWFGRVEFDVFNDVDGDGVWDEGEAPIAEQATILRYRDGTVYGEAPTDHTGYYAFDETFPFFNWLVAEVDFGRFQQTGATITVDQGGATNGVNTPQPQNVADPFNAHATTENRTHLSETDTGLDVLLQGVQTFQGMTNVMHFGKKRYEAGQNGGISGIVYYATTRADFDPRLAAGDPWEPGIPRVQVTLYKDDDADGVIDDLNGDGKPTLADVDNYPLGWFEMGGQPGLEDVDHDGDQTFDPGDAVQIAHTDSFDDNQPTGCPGGGPGGGALMVDGVADPFFLGGRCYDGIRNWNQVRPTVFDGGYAFESYFPNGMANPGEQGEQELPPGMYIVQTAVPPGYKTIKEEDFNVTLGNEYTPAEPGAAPMGAQQTQIASAQSLQGPPPVNADVLVGIGAPPCVGALHLVPDELSLFPGEVPFNEMMAPFHGEMRPLCDMKQVHLSAGQNGVADFFLFTEVPVASLGTGNVTDDLGFETTIFNPNFGEKFSPPWVPVSFHDWTGKELTRVYTDEVGRFNAALPSTWSVHVPMASGVSPFTPIICINSPTLPSGAPDPHYDAAFTTSCYVNAFIPGGVTYLDLPLIRQAAFPELGVDVEFPAGTPMIHSVSAGNPGGPYVSNNAANATITIRSMGTVQVENPAFSKNPILNQGASKLIDRDFGFGGSPGEVTCGALSFGIGSWTNDQIVANYTGGSASPGATCQLEVKRGDNGKSSITGVTLTFGPVPYAVIEVAPGQSVQAAIDGAAPGALILVEPGIYEDFVIMWKPVKLQGWGPGGTHFRVIRDFGQMPAKWREKLQAVLANSNGPTLVPGQPIIPGDFVDQELFSEETACVAVFGRANGTRNGPDPGAYGFNDPGKARIDGITCSNAAVGGGIVVNGYVNNFQISNTRLTANQGLFQGGIRAGHPGLGYFGPGVIERHDAHIDNLRIHHNQIIKNGALRGCGGGISLNTGADNYQVTQNWIGGNFMLGEGGGICHNGLVGGTGRITENTIIFNQSFHQELSFDGGGLMLAGGLKQHGGQVGVGTGNVLVDGNLIQGNQAGAGSGGGIFIFSTGGNDNIHIVNNIIVNNQGGVAAGGMALENVGGVGTVKIIHNTIARNESTASAGTAFLNPNVSTPTPAGIDCSGGGPCKPTLFNNVILENRAFYVDLRCDPVLEVLQQNLTCTGGGPAPAATPYFDLDSSLDPRFSILTDTTGFDGSNREADGATLFETPYFNGAPTLNVRFDRFGVGIALDEGGNFLGITFGPRSLYQADGMTPNGNYHIKAGTPAISCGNRDILGAVPALASDFDRDGRPNPMGTDPDCGADESADSVPSPIVRSVSPSSGSRGATLPVVITGDNFQSGASVSFGSGITVNAVTFNSATQLTVNITIAVNATLGFRTVTVTNPGGASGSKPNSFEVVQVKVDSVSPPSGNRGATLVLTITGQNFQPGASVSFSGNGITVNSVTFNSATKLTVNIKIANNAARNARTVTVTNPDGGSGSKSNAFRVN